jgi:hypothetical protein
MRSREWAIAEAFRTPADYGIPDLPAWGVRRGDDGRLTLVGDDTEAFIAADRPMKVRR